MVFTRVTFLELLEMNEGVVPGVEKEILLPALPVVGPVLDGPGRQHASDGFQKFERNQIKARLSICPLCVACKPRDAVCGLHANAGTVFQKAAQGKVGESTRRAS